MSLNLATLKTTTVAAALAGGIVGTWAGVGRSGAV